MAQLVAEESPQRPDIEHEETYFPMMDATTFIFFDARCNSF
jgi:hypothetical protein